MDGWKERHMSYIDDISNILGLCLQLPTYYLFVDAEHALLMAVKVMAK